MNINEETLRRCRKLLKENLLKRFIRFILIKFIVIRYGVLIMGEGFRFGKNWDIRRGMISTGHFSYIGPRVQIIYPTQVGDLAMIAADVHFIGNDHGFEEAGMPMRLAEPKVPPEKETTYIESESWVGQRAIILHGIRIGRGSIVAAGSVVTKDVPPYSIVAGVPARVIRKRFDDKGTEDKHDVSLYGK